MKLGNEELSLVVSEEGKFRNAVRTAVLAGLAVGAAPAYAQTTAPAAAPADKNATELETVEVTGSRLPQLNVTSTSSLTLVNDEEIKFQGTINIETLLNSMPQAFAEFSQGDSNGATGTATVSLRGLGSSRTLVLIDGKRLMPGDPLLSPSAANLNFIPAPLVDQIQILSGGASAVYGSDAIAGVVNFIMKKDFEGFRLDTQLGESFHNDALTRDYYAVWGTNFGGGNGNVTLYAGYTTLNALTQDQRDFSACSITTPSTGANKDKHICAGSRTIAEGLIYSYGDYAYHLIDPAGGRQFVPDDGRTFNFAPYNYFQRPTDRYSLGGFAHREINESLDLYANAMFMDDRTKADVAPSGLFFVNASMPCNNPFMSAQQQTELCGGNAGTANMVDILFAKRTVELGPREADLRHTDYRIVGGLKGQIPFVEALSYDISFQRGEDIYASSNNGYVNTTNARAGIQVTDDGTGAPVCADTTGATAVPSADTSCVPLDLFQLGALTDSMKQYMGATGFTQANMVEEVVNGIVTADLGRWGVRIPLATSGVGLAVGAEHRMESLVYRPDTLVAGGLLGGGGGPSPAVRGSYVVDEMFGELRLPIAENLPGVNLLQFDAAYRASDYSTAGNVEASKFGLQYAPIEQVALRASIQKAVRAPQVTELYSPQALGLFGGSDPCSGKQLQAAGANAPTQAQCANSGVTATQYNNGVNNVNPQIPDCLAGQCNAKFGGNPSLDVEDSTTTSYGIVVTPIKDLVFTVDYFHINIEDVISVPPPTSSLQTCIASGDPVSCARVHRSPGNGALWGEPTNPNVGFIDAFNDNLLEFDTKGIDVEGDYKVALGGVGRLGVNYVSTFLTKLDFLGNGSDCAGLYGVTCGTPSPKYRHKFRTTWYSPFGATVSAQWRYYQGTDLDKNTSDPNLKSGTVDNIDASLEDKHYLDLSANYTLPWTANMAKAIILRAGINNVGDTQPQVVSSNAPNAISSPPFGNGNTFPNVYDVYGRSYFIGLQADF